METEEIKEKIRAHNHAYYLAHKKEIISKQKHRYKNKKKEILIKHKEWIKHNRQRVRELGRIGTRKFYWRHAEEIKRKNRMEYSSPERKAVILESQKRLRMRSKIYVLKMYGGECALCNTDEMAVLSIDHINNDGYKDRKLSHSQYEILKRNLQNGQKRDDLQVLCMNCQFRKRIYGDNTKNWDRSKIFLSSIPLPVFRKCRSYGSGRMIK
jgi:hypothetical protein